MPTLGTAYKRHTDFDGYDVIVIGSGIGGLTAAALLSRFGHKRVLVLERHFTAGGFTHTFTRPGYEWDVGVHYIGQVLGKRTLLSRLFATITEGRLQWASLGQVYDQAVIGDFTFNFVAGRENLRAALHAAFPHESAAIEGYFQAVGETVAASQNYFAAKTLPGLAGKAAQRMARGFYRYAERTVHAVLTELGASPLLKAVLTAQYGDYGLPPKQASFAMQALLAHHYFEGAAYPVGGSSSLAANIIPLVEAQGGAVLVRAEVQKILIRDGKAVGVQMHDGREILAPAVVSDAGFATTFTRLVPPETAQRIGALEAVQRVGLSMAHFALHVGLESSAEALNLPKHNLWLYPNERHDENVARYLADPEAPFPMLFISSAAARDPDFAHRHPGHATLEIVAPANWAWFQRWEHTRWQKRGPDYEAFKARIRERLLEALYTALPQTRGHVRIAELGTPLSTLTFAGHPQGSIYGLAHTPARFHEPLLRPATPIRGLYLTGADISTAGVGGAAAGGLLTASVILKRNLIKALAQPQETA